MAYSPGRAAPTTRAAATKPESAFARSPFGRTSDAATRGLRDHLIKRKPLGVIVTAEPLRSLQCTNPQVDHDLAAGEETFAGKAKAAAARSDSAYRDVAM